MVQYWNTSPATSMFLIRQINRTAQRRGHRNVQWCFVFSFHFPRGGRLKIWLGLGGRRLPGKYCRNCRTNASWTVVTVFSVLSTDKNLVSLLLLGLLFNIFGIYDKRFNKLSTSFVEHQLVQLAIYLQLFPIPCSSNIKWTIPNLCTDSSCIIVKGLTTMPGKAIGGCHWTSQCCYQEIKLLPFFIHVKA